MLVIYQYGHKILFDGYLIRNISVYDKMLNISKILFDGYLIKTKHPLPTRGHKTLGVKWLFEPRHSHQSSLYLDSEVVPKSPTFHAVIVRKYYCKNNELKMRLKNL